MSMISFRLLFPGAMWGASAKKMARTDQLAYIEAPPRTGDPVKSLSYFLTLSGKWREGTARKNWGMLSDI
jgi:hypothetical protein